MIFSAVSSHGQAVFEFPNNGPLDVAGIGEDTSALDPSSGINVTLTTTGIIGQDGSTEGNVTNSTGNNALGVDSANDLGGFGNNEARDFNPGEAWIFQFDNEVLLDAIDFAGFGVGAEVTISSSAFPDMVFNDGTVGGDFGLGGVSVPASTDIMIQLTSDASTEDTGIRLRFLTVTAVPGVSTGAELIWTGNPGDSWNTTAQNFTNDGAPASFAFDDNVTIQTPGGIVIDAGGITAGAVTDANAEGSVGLQDGALAANTFVKSGAGTLAISNTVDVSTGVTTLSGGILQVEGTGSFDTLALILSGGSILQIDSGGGFASGDTNTLGDGGGSLMNSDDLTLSGLGNAIIDAPFTKLGAGVLTFDLGLGVQNDGPVNLNILGGEILAVGTDPASQLNVGSSNVFDGVLTLDGPILMLHGSSVTGTGSIAIEFSSTIESRFNRGPVLVSVPVVINGNFTLDSPNGDNVLTIGGIISGSGSVTKTGNGRAVLAAENTYFADTIIEAGTLQIGDGVSGTLGGGGVFVEVPANGTRGTIEFNGNSPVVIESEISGEGDVVVNNAAGGSTELNSTNSYSGTTVISGGTLIVPALANGGTPSSIGASGAASENLVLQGLATLSYTGLGASIDRGFSLGGVENESVSGGGTISADGSGPLSFTNTTMVGQDGTGSAPRVLTLSGTAPGTSSIALAIGDGQASTHSVVKSGPTTWELSGANTYTGDTTVEEGRLILTTAFLADQSTVSIASGAILELSHEEGDLVSSLFLDGEAVAGGTYGSTAAVAGIPDAIADDTHFAGSGFLVVIGPPSDDFATWAQSFGVVGGPADDDDEDGLTNQVEYAFALNPVSGSSVSPITTVPDPVTGLFTFNRRDPALTGLVYSYASSTNLEEFTPFTPEPEAIESADAVETVTIRIPDSLLENEVLFVRVTAE